MRPILLFSWYNTVPQKVNLLKRKNTQGLRYIPQYGTFLQERTVGHSCKKQTGDTKYHSGGHEEKLDWVRGRNPEFLIKGQPPRWWAEGALSCHRCTVCSYVRAETCFPQLNCGPGTKTLWKEIIFELRWLYFQSASSNFLAQRSLQFTVHADRPWHLGAQQPNGKSSGLVPQRPFLSCLLQITLSEYIILSSKLPSEEIQAET